MNTISRSIAGLAAAFALLTFVLAPTAALLAGEPAAQISNELGAADFLPSAGHPVGYMGDYTGRYSGAAGPCLEWSDPNNINPEPKKNIRWKTLLKGFTQSQPIVVGKKLFTLEEPNHLVCLDADTGNILWRKTFDHFELFSPAERERGRKLLKTIDETHYEYNRLCLEYQWLKSTFPYRIPGGPWQRKGLLNDLPETAARVAEIERVFVDRGFGGTPDKPHTTGGHGWFCYEKTSPKWKWLVDDWVDLLVDFGVSPMKISHFYWNGNTLATPASDGTHIYLHFGYGHVVCIDLDGRAVWARWFPDYLDKAACRKALLERQSRDVALIGFNSASPILVEDCLIATKGYVIRGLNRKSGDILWEIKYGDGVQADCPSGKCADQGPSLATMADGSRVLLCPQGYVVDPLNGKILYQNEPLRMYGTPLGIMGMASLGDTVHGDTCYFAWGGGVGALRIARTGPGAVSVDKLWITEVPEGYTCKTMMNMRLGTCYNHENTINTAPVYDPDRKRLYLTTGLPASALLVFDAVTGELIKELPAESQYTWNERQHPVLVGRKYVFNMFDLGWAQVIDADTLERVSTNVLLADVHRDMARWTKPWSEMKILTVDRWFFVPEFWLRPCNQSWDICANIFVQGKNMYVRSIEGMYCIGLEPTKPADWKPAKGDPK